MAIRLRGRSIAVDVKVPAGQNPTGHPVRFQGTANTREAARILEAKANAALRETGVFKPETSNPRPATQARASTRTIEAAIRLAWDHAEIGWKHNRTGTESLRDAELAAAIIGPQKPVTEVSAKTYEHLIKELASDGKRGERTIKRICQNFHRAMHFAELEGWIGTRPHWVPPKGSATRSRSFVFSPKMEALMLDFTVRAYGPDNDLHDALILGTDLGLRLSNILSLAPEWIDMEERTITVPYSHAKNGEGGVVIIWSQRAMDIIKRRLSAPHTDQQFLFDPRFTKFTVAKLMREVRAGMGQERNKDFVFHATRHTAATRYEARGLSEAYIMDQLLHKRTKGAAKVTQGYIHPEVEQRRNAMMAMQGAK